MADAASLGVKIFEEKIIIQPETEQICRHFKLDPLQLIGSGALLIAATPEKARKIIEKLKQENIKASIIGEFLAQPNERLIIRKNHKTETLQRPVSDQLWKALSRQ